MATLGPLPCGPPPSAAFYKDPATCLAAIQGHACTNRYAIIITSRKPNRIVYQCDRSGHYNLKGKNPNTHESKQRSNTASKKCNCPFKLALKLTNIDEMPWELSIIEASHNHIGSEASTAHSKHRRAAISMDIEQSIMEMYHAGISVAKILAKLRLEDSTCTLVAKDIYNIAAYNRLVINIFNRNNTNISID
jgi:hypothetical protein